jgi:mono/diheme cytochrome c family protein
MNKNFYLGVNAALLIGVLAAPMTVSAAPVTITLPEPQQSFRPGPGADLAGQYCVICHSSDYISMQPPMGRDKWLATVNKMRKVFGCPLPESDAEKVAAYLDSAYGPKMKGHP